MDDAVGINELSQMIPELTDLILPWIGVLISIVIFMWCKDFASQLAKGLAFKHDPHFQEGDLDWLEDEPATINKIGERQIRLDCDVIQADGGTRCASITGAWVALHNAFTKLVSDGKLEEFPMTDTISAISCGICSGVPLLDLDYAEDLNAETDANFVLTGRGAIVEIQGTAEKAPFSRELLDKLIDLAFKGTKDLAKLQKESISTSSLKFNGNL